MSAAPPTPKTATSGKRQPMNEDAWQNEFGKHRQRLDKQKSCIPKPAMAASLGGSQKSPRKVPVSPRSTPKTQKTDASSSGRASASMTLDSLPAAERRVCEDMIGVLFSKSEEEGKSLLQAVFLAAESKRLLANYGGVYPSLDTMSGSQPPSNTGSMVEAPRRQE